MHNFKDVGRTERLDEAKAREIMPVGKHEEKSAGKKIHAWESRLGGEISSRRVGHVLLSSNLHFLETDWQKR